MRPMKTPSTPESAKRSKDNERPLLEDIRLLGRILGDEIREQEGVEAFELIENLIKLSNAAALLKEANELTAIFVTSRKTTQRP